MPRPGVASPDPKLERAVQERVAAGDYVSALRVIDGADGLSASRVALLRAGVAHALFAHGWDGAALQVAAAAWSEAPEAERVGFAGLAAGLAAWRLGQPALALDWFDQAANAPVASAGMRAAGAFWAARACLRLHDLGGYHARLRQERAGNDSGSIASDFILLERNERWSLYCHYYNGDTRLMIQLSEIKPESRGFVNPEHFTEHMYDYLSGLYGVRFEEEQKQEH